MTIPRIKNVALGTIARDFDAWKILHAILCEAKKDPPENCSCVSKVVKRLRFMSLKGLS